MVRLAAGRGIADKHYEESRYIDWIKGGDSDVVALLDELEAAEKRIAELEAREETLRPVGVISEKAFHRLEGSESRFIALWPRPGIYLPRKRPEDGVIVYARTDGIALDTGK
jgi:hypothetical protein